MISLSPERSTRVAGHLLPSVYILEPDLSVHLANLPHRGMVQLIQSPSLSAIENGHVQPEIWFHTFETLFQQCRFRYLC